MLLCMKMPGFRLPKNQKFAYKPRYWDPKEEEKKERADRLKLLEDGGTEAMKERISSTFRRSSGSGGYTGSYRNRQVAKSNFVLVAVIIGLLYFSYLMLTVYLPRIEDIF